MHTTAVGEDEPLHALPARVAMVSSPRMAARTNATLLYGRRADEGAAVNATASGRTPRSGTTRPECVEQEGGELEQLDGGDSHARGGEERDADRRHRDGSPGQEVAVSRERPEQRHAATAVGH